MHLNFGILGLICVKEKYSEDFDAEFRYSGSLLGRVTDEFCMKRLLFKIKRAVIQNEGD